MPAFHEGFPVIITHYEYHGKIISYFSYPFRHWHTHSFRMTNEKRDSLFHHIRGTFQNFRVKMRKHVPFAVNTVFLEFDELEEATEDGVVGAAGVVGV